MIIKVLLFHGNHNGELNAIHYGSASNCTITGYLEWYSRYRCAALDSLAQSTQRGADEGGSWMEVLYQPRHGRVLP